MMYSSLILMQNKDGTQGKPYSSRHKAKSTSQEKKACQNVGFELSEEDNNFPHNHSG
jgi:hypothetical protein